MSLSPGHQLAHYEILEPIGIAGQMAEALEGGHEVGIIHRDLKPDNIMLEDRRDAPDFVKVLDFGIARYIEGYGSEFEDDQEEVTAANQLCGTPQYMAPEQISSAQYRICRSSVHLETKNVSCRVLLVFKSLLAVTRCKLLYNS